MTLSFNKLNEIAALYENIAASEQEVLNEIGVNFGGQKAVDAVKQRASNDSAFNKKLDALRNQRFGGSKLTLDKPAAKPTAPAAKPTAPAAKPAASTPAKTPAATPSKVIPTKPAAATPAKPAMGTTAGGTKFERRAATGAELAAARKARDEAKAAGNTKGAEEAAVKAGVAAGKSTLKQSFEYDAYDFVLEYLLSQGHAETVAEAQYLMTEMDAEMIGDIIEARMDPRGRPASGPMNVYAKSKGKPDQAHLDAVKAYDEKQKKKTPEQRKAELDAYKERQRNR
jgi:hypothetical protein